MCVCARVCVCAESFLMCLVYRALFVLGLGGLGFWGTTLRPRKQGIHLVRTLMIIRYMIFLNTGLRM